MTGWFHDFAVLGSATNIPSWASENQAVKTSHLFPLINEALASANGTWDGRAVDLFCADGLYGHYMLSKGVQDVTFIDKGTGSFRVLEAAELLGHSGRATCMSENMPPIPGEWDLAVFAGGLYHLSKPWVMLESLRAAVVGQVVFQTIYDERHEDDDHESYGSSSNRCSRVMNERWIREAGFEVVESSTAVLTGNVVGERGALFALLE